MLLSCLLASARTLHHLCRLAVQRSVVVCHVVQAVYMSRVIRTVKPQCNMRTHEHLIQVFWTSAAVSQQCCCALLHCIRIATADCCSSLHVRVDCDLLCKSSHLSFASHVHLVSIHLYYSQQRILLRCLQAKDARIIIKLELQLLSSAKHS
jgi:hypothetical protein